MNGTIKSANYVEAHIDQSYNNIPYGGVKVSDNLYLHNDPVAESWKTVINWKYGPSILDDENNYNNFKNAIGKNVIIKYREKILSQYDKATNKLVKKSISSYEIVSVSLTK